MSTDRRLEPLDGHRASLERLGAAVLESRGVLAADARIAAAERQDVPEPFASYVDAIHDHAYRITDGVVADLKAAGAGEDEVFEITVAAAFGAARRRLDAALAATRAATEGR
jgi:hypothetical protein